MGSKAKLNKFHKETMKKEAKEKLLSKPGVDVFEKLNNFYKLHPKSTPAVAEEVRKIRAESEAFSKALMDKFESENARLITEYMQRELDYLESYISDEQKEKDKEFLEAEIEEQEAGPVMQGEVGDETTAQYEPRKGFLARLFNL